MVSYRYRILFGIVLCSGCQWTGWGEETPLPAPSPPASSQETNQDEENTVRVLFNPSERTLPFPSDLFLTSLGLSIAPSTALNHVEESYFASLQGKDGFPTQSAMYFSLSGPIDETSIGGALNAFNLTTQEELRITFEYDGHGIRLIPEETLQPGQTYVFFLQDTLRDTEGLRVKADDAFLSARSYDELDEPELESLRLAYQPYFRACENRGVYRTEMIGLSAFTTESDDTHIRLDLREHDYPLPHSFWVDGETQRVALSNDELGAEFSVGFSSYDGFGASSALLIRSHLPLDPNTWLDAAAVRLFRIDDHSLQEVTDLKRTLVESHVLGLQPRLPLEHSARYAIVILDSVTTFNHPFKANLIQTASTLDSPLLSDGHSTLRSVSSADARILESERISLRPLYDSLENNGISVSSIVAAYTFPTTTAPQWADDMRDELYAQDISTVLEDVVVASPIDRGLWLVMPNVETIVSGTMPIYDSIDPTTGRRAAAGPTVSGADFVLTIPENAPEPDSIPVVLFGHGLTTSRELVYLVADMLAERGYASIGIDFPYHGNRSVCLGDLTCVGDARCAANGQCVENDGTPGELVSISSLYDNGFTVPTTSGLAFIDLDDIFASRDHILQGIADLCQLVRVIEENDWASISGGFGLNTNDLMYLGISLGGILGAGFAAVEPKVDHFAFNVSGVSLIDIMMDSTILGPVLNSHLEERGIEQGTPEFYYFALANRWAIDPADPANYIRDADAKRLLVQMAQGDDVVPNLSSEILAELANVPLNTYTPLISNHAFLFDPTSLEGQEAREQILEFFDARFH